MAGAEGVRAARLGMYRYPELSPVQLFDAAGNPFADWLTIELP